jgi:hypothetical protein
MIFNSGIHADAVNKFASRDCHDEVAYRYCHAVVSWSFVLVFTSLTSIDSCKTTYL